MQERSPGAFMKVRGCDQDGGSAQGYDSTKLAVKQALVVRQAARPAVKSGRVFSVTQRCLTRL